MNICKNCKHWNLPAPQSWEIVEMKPEYLDQGIEEDEGRIRFKPLGFFRPKKRYFPKGEFEKWGTYEDDRKYYHITGYVEDAVYDFAECLRIGEGEYGSHFGFPYPNDRYDSAGLSLSENGELITGKDFGCTLFEAK